MPEYALNKESSTLDLHAAKPARILVRWYRAASADPLRNGAMLLMCLIFGVIFIYPMLRLGLYTLYQQNLKDLTLANYGLLVSDPALRNAIANSFVVAFWVTLFSVLVALPVAWGLARTDMAAKGWIRILVLLTFASPSFFAALGWLLLLGPRGGKLNLLIVQVLGLQESPLNIMTPGGIVFVLVLFSYPFVVLTATAALENMDGSMEEASRTLGASALRTTAQIVAPLIAPAIAAGAILVFVESLVVFGPPAVLGAPIGYGTMSTELVSMFGHFPPRLELGAVLAVPTILGVTLLLVLRNLLLGRRQFAVIGGKPSKAEEVKLRGWRWPLTGYCFVLVFLSVGVPFLTLLYTSSLRAVGRGLSPENFGLVGNFTRLFSQPLALSALWHSLVLGVGAALGAVLLGTLAAYFVERSTTPGRGSLTLLVLSPLAFPGVTLGAALLLSYANEPLRLQGTLAILLLAYVSHNVPRGFAFAAAALRQVHAELEEAARCLGAGWAHCTRTITVPLIGNSLLASGSFIFILSFRELGASVLLQTRGNEVVGPTVFEFLEEFNYGLMCSLSVIVFVVTFIVVLAARQTLAKRFISI